MKGQTASFDGGILLRYENEFDHLIMADRERLRAIAALGLTSQLSEHWSVYGQVRTGLRNKQNVPAITLHQFSEQDAGDKDIYISNLYAKATFDKSTWYVGKIPWKTDQVTDLFWDRDLNPLGVHLDYQLNEQNKIKFTSFMPLDGEGSTVGHMSILQFTHNMNTDLGQLTLSPWFVDYHGASGAKYAIRDTEYDNQFIRFSGALKQGKWQVGTDIGLSLNSNLEDLDPEFADERLSYAVELKYGSLKTVGNYLTQLKYIHVERFSVVTEFAQNASSRFATSNFEGWDLRIRHKLTNKLWVGGRLSQTERLIGTPERSVRFRLETKYTF